MHTSARAAALVSLFAVAFVASAQNFSDVPASSPYANAIQYVKLKSIVDGYPDGTFRPDATVTRAELTKMIVASLLAQHVVAQGLDMEWITSHLPLLSFKDVRGDEWYAPYVRLGRAYAIIKGYPDGTFGPDKSVTVAEASKIIAVANSLPLGLSQEQWFTPYVDALRAKHAIADEIHDYSKPMTRGQLAYALYELGLHAQLLVLRPQLLTQSAETSSSSAAVSSRSSSVSSASSAADDISALSCTQQSTAGSLPTGSFTAPRLTANGSVVFVEQLLGSNPTGGISTVTPTEYRQGWAKMPKSILAADVDASGTAYVLGSPCFSPPSSGDATAPCLEIVKSKSDAQEASMAMPPISQASDGWQYWLRAGAKGRIYATAFDPNAGENSSVDLVQISTGDGQGKLFPAIGTDRLIDMEADKDGTVYALFLSATDSTISLTRIDAEGNAQKQWATLGVASDASNIAFDAKNNLYIVACSGDQGCASQRMIKIMGEGKSTVVDIAGTSSYGSAQTSAPFLSIDPSGRAYVSAYAGTPTTLKLFVLSSDFKTPTLLWKDISPTSSPPLYTLFLSQGKAILLSLDKQKLRILRCTLK